ncbi:MAG: hypothetical protein NT003_03590 [Candidatus Magasanikbacteria bacterium]|nr:hypothetical protein [Candidatus Magasanikbacteria bacterium]
MSSTLPTQTQSLPQEVQFFLERMLDDAGIAPDNVQLRGVMVTELAGRLQQQLILDLLDKMAEDKFPEFETLMETNPSSDRILLFLKLSIPNNDEIVAASMLAFKNTFVASATA